MDHRGPASLPMYDLTELRGPTDALWRAIADHLRRHGCEAGRRLSRPQRLAQHWRDPTLLLSQSCGYPLLGLPGHVRVVATPVYAATGCEGACYRSGLIVRRDDRAADLDALRGGVCAVNAWDSNSGMNMLRAMIAPWLQGRETRGRSFFRRVVVTGSHAASIAAVGAGRADIAAIDCVTLALLERHRPELVAPVRVLDWTMPAPGLPLINAGDDRVLDLLRAALAAVAADPELAGVRQALLLDRFVVLPDDAYRAIRVLEEQAIAAGYPVLA